MSDVKSPCVRNCCLNDEDVCLGCGRTITEICAWSQAAPEKKQVILEASKNRLLEMKNR